jgi:hypothetical protein
VKKTEIAALVHGLTGIGLITMTACAAVAIVAAMISWLFFDSAIDPVRLLIVVGVLGGAWWWLLSGSEDV